MKAKPHQSNEQIPRIGRHTDHTCQQRALVRWPRFHDQRYAQRPFPAHSKSGNEPQHTQLPRGAREEAKAGEDRIGQNAQRHSPDPPQAVTQPAKPQPTDRRAHKEQGCNAPHPQSD